MKRNELLKIVAASIEMQEARGINPMCRHSGITLFIEQTSFLMDVVDYEFPICVIESRPVFKGDMIWFVGYGKAEAREVTLKSNQRISDYFLAVDGGMFKEGMLSWSKPVTHPKTVMVELDYGDVIGGLGDGRFNSRMAESCRKALENLNVK